MLLDVRQCITKKQLKKLLILKSTKHAYKTKDRVTRTPLKIGGWTQGKRGNRIYISPNETKIYGF
jgi:hypothetical protein